MSCGKMELESRRAYGDVNGMDEELVEKMVYEALVWCSLHGLVLGDTGVKRSGTSPGVGIVHAPISLLPVSFPESHWKQACELAPLFNELVDRVSLDAEFLQHTLSRTRKVDGFTSRLLGIHSKMVVLGIGKKEDIRLGIHRSDYMLDEQTNLLLQIEMNTISSATAGLSCLVGELHRSLLCQYGEHLGLDHKRVPGNPAVSRIAEALAKAWSEYSNPRAIVLIVVQTEEHNMYDQHWLSAYLREKHNVRMVRKTLAEIEEGGVLQPDGRLLIGEEEVAVVYFRAGYTPTDYPTEAEWSARLLIEQSSAVKCPSISYHLAGTKKVQQELAKPNVLERFVEKKADVAKLRKCFAGLWSLDDAEIVKDAIDRAELYVMKPQREGGGNNLYGDDMRESLLRFQREGSEESAAYILMQKIIPATSPAILIRDGISRKVHAVSEIGIYSAYLRSNDKVIVNYPCGYLVRTKASSTNEGGFIAGAAVLDSIYLK